MRLIIAHYSHTGTRTRGFLCARCDAPALRRYLRLEMAPLADGHVELRSQILKTENRESVDLLRPDLPRSDEIITMCSMCPELPLFAAG